MLTDTQVSQFEADHGIRLPEEFWWFVTRIGHGGYGPACGLLPMERWICRGAAKRGERLDQPFPVDPDLEVPTSLDMHDGIVGSCPGTIQVADGGCTTYTLLVVTGSGRGRLVEDYGDLAAPRYCADSDFLSWYERWLDFVLAGHRSLTSFSHQMAGDEDRLVATLRHDPSTARRRAAAYTFITYPGPSDMLVGSLLQALAAEPHPAVRETILRALAAQDEDDPELPTAALADPHPRIRSLAAGMVDSRTPNVHSGHSPR
ncbi:hypothetical protein [Rhizohabitans arisaemae]|uniref:hypothetical protein n=1 Tax=Rhizohabitans arisaemae TaxID=2720610 RepID=UPI0024B1B75C|nr:hypothetical protein [Rhizohabitans arisaemae]